MHIRIATLNDIPKIMQLMADVVPAMIASGNLQWDNHYPNVEVFTSDIGKHQLWVAEIDNQIAGITAITTDQEPEYIKVGWDISKPAIVTHRLAVSPQCRGLGIASALLQQAEHEALHRDIKTLRIDTSISNQATQKLFPKLGYVFAGETDLRFRPGLKFYCFEKSL